jgi:hypothetical protein
MNATGNYKRQVKAEDLIGFKDDAEGKPPFDPEKRRREFLETARQHKAKFWGLIKGRSLDDVKLPEAQEEGETGMVPALPDMRVEKIKAIIAGDKG